MKDEKSILQEAHDIVNIRDEEKTRRYGDFDECMGRVSTLATVLTGKKITVDDAFNILIALKLSRESHSHKRDNLVDLCGYIQGAHNHRESIKSNKYKFTPMPPAMTKNYTQDERGRLRIHDDFKTDGQRWIDDDDGHTMNILRNNGPEE